jgi:hypothetical protein
MTGQCFSAPRAEQEMSFPRKREPRHFWAPAFAGMTIFLFCGALAGFVVFAATAALAQTAVPDLSGRDPHWIKDAARDCWAANPDPEPSETIAWSGACEAGLISGKGTLSWYIEGKLVGRDDGNFVRGELSGHGRISTPAGSFEGEFPGHGVMTLSDGRKVDAVSVKETAGWSIEQAR